MSEKRPKRGPISTTITRAAMPPQVWTWARRRKHQARYVQAVFAVIFLSPLQLSRRTNPPQE